MTVSSKVRTGSSDSSDSSDSIAVSAAGRRVRFGLQSLVLVVSVTASCLFTGLIASRFPARFDATATREHLLSERTQNTLNGLDGEYEIVVAANRSGVDPRAYERTRSVLDSFARASKRVVVTFIDTGSSGGIGEYDALLKRLSERFSPEIGANRVVVDRAIEACRAQQEGITALVGQLTLTRESVRGTDIKSQQLRQLLDDYSARGRVAAFNLEQAASGAGKQLLETIGPGALGLAPVDDVATQLSRAIGTVTSDVSRLLREMKLVEQAGDVPGAMKDQVRPMVPALQGSLDVLRSAGDSLDRMPRVSIFAVARTLEKSSAALVIGPQRGVGADDAGAAGKAGKQAGTLTAIDFVSLFPPAMPEGSSGAVSIDRRARAEELTATAIASLGSGAGGKAGPPIVVLMHDQPMKFAPTFEPFVAMMDRLSLRGIDVVEWATALDAEEPAAIAGLRGGVAGGGGARPVVYVTQTTSPNTQEAADRMKRMAGAMAKVVGQGKSMLVSANVSTLPGIGTADPLVEFLEPLGMKVETGTPLMQRVQTAGGPVVLTNMMPRRAEGEHPISRAIDGLGMHFFWVVPVREVSAAVGAHGTVPGGSGVKKTPIVRIEPDGNTWAESEWLGYARVPSAQRGSVIDPPMPDSPRDDAQGPWEMVVAAERSDPSLDSGMQRVVVVGCSGWFLDDVTQQSVGVIDGRPVLTSPGNLELLEASVLWLAGQEELIARSPTAQAVPTIRSLTAGQTQAVRWSLMAGLPGLVLLVGAGWRLWRG